MKEYTLYLRRGNGRPYGLGTYNCLDGAKMKVYDIIQTEIERNRPYYLDNDFFDNQYSVIDKNTFYVCILERDVTEWKKCTSEEKIKNNNLSYFYKF